MDASETNDEFIQAVNESVKALATDGVLEHEIPFGKYPAIDKDRLRFRNALLGMGLYGEVRLFPTRDHIVYRPDTRYMYL